MARLQRAGLPQRRTTTPTTRPRAFRDWLRGRYGTLDALNDAWGTAFWSQRYGDWEQILPPRLAPTHPNPTQQLDFKRFSSDALKDYLRAERDLLRAITPDVPVTTNFMVIGQIDGHRLRRLGRRGRLRLQRPLPAGPARRTSTSCRSRPTSPAASPAGGRGS